MMRSNKKERYYMNYNIKAILFDSGRVLNGPVTGHWFITPNFFTYVNEKDFVAIPKEQKHTAFEKAGLYISQQKLILTEEDEFKHFLIYYKILFKHMPELNLSEEQIESITKDLVYNYDKYKFFQDVVQVIPELHKSYKLAVVSDAWPSLENVFIKAGMREYFSSFVISSIQGVTKPHEIMYKTALEELGVAPTEAIFIDDNIINCNGAKKIGISSYLLCRDWQSFVNNKVICKHHKVIHNLKHLQMFL
jgi:putative hydrolase of the HAD superfamily